MPTGQVPSADAECLVLFGDARLDDAPVIHSLLFVLLHTCKHRLHNSRGQNETGKAKLPDFATEIK
jgi:hypothetical protein